ncbi:MAG TPA: hypothetical protein VNH41_02315 [Steroidobacteraceae bacterium]|nr:hypothetical protein [Steroidobacteraceae bacterium]
MAIPILLKTTIGPVADDWNVGRFSLLAAHLGRPQDQRGDNRYQVSARDRVEGAAGEDRDLAQAAAGAYAQVWLIATDTVGALTDTDIENIKRFRAAGGGILITRDHQDLGACLAKLGALGATQYFQAVNPDPEPSRRCRDDRETPSISWPNFHSGANGDLQVVTATQPVHPLMRRPGDGVIQRLPAHPHEGAVGVPDSLRGSARVVAQGRSTITGTAFNLCVAVEEAGQGRAVSDSSFHHFCDYNWDPRRGCPSFVTETAGFEVLSSPRALDDVHCYVENIAAWLNVQD